MTTVAKFSQRTMQELGIPLPVPNDAYPTTSFLSVVCSVDYELECVRLILTLSVFGVLVRL